MCGTKRKRKLKEEFGPEGTKRLYVYVYIYIYRYMEYSPTQL